MHKMENIDISAAISLFEITLSERSGFVRDVKAAENLREYKLATTTNFCCDKAKKDLVPQVCVSYLTSI